MDVQFTVTQTLEREVTFIVDVETMAEAREIKRQLTKELIYPSNFSDEIEETDTEVVKQKVEIAEC